MFIQNDSERRWVNGTIGRVHDIREVTNKETKKKEPAIMVELQNGKVVEVRPYTWEISRYVFIDGEFQRDVMGTYTQLPLRLAWAITIHKSQGKTFDKVVIDFGRGTFVHGQTYVALSRCTSLEGIVLRQPFTRNSIIMDDLVRYFNS
jgi:ATP-dependent exoDNAse (exonuclease V) alpha subunit